jgi:hypothetical protein
MLTSHFKSLLLYLYSSFAGMNDRMNNHFNTSVLSIVIG